MDITMKWENVYKKLIKLARQHDMIVHDKSCDALILPILCNAASYFIHINKRRGWACNCFFLAHEIGHAMKIHTTEPLVLKFRSHLRYMSKEKTASNFALKILDILKPNMNSRDRNRLKRWYNESISYWTRKKTKCKFH
jgi:Zn-dependent peptidase ImmA (M78 family)